MIRRIAAFMREYASGAVLLGLAVAVCIAAPGVSPGAAAAGYKASVTFLKGMARLEAAGTGKYTNLSLGQAASEGDTIVTLDNTKVELKLENGTIIRLGEGTRFTVKTLQRTSLGGLKGFFRVATGRVWFTVAKLTGDSELQTQTPSVVAAVKGTVWRADVDKDGKTDVLVYDGVVTAKREGSPDVEIAKM
jgi:hypothetical protein